jgi:diadenosine tetraphosphate (Ap4A) HIT family hydrolase
MQRPEIYFCKHSPNMPPKTCPFCVLDPARILAEDELTVVYKDGFPVSPGHTVVIPKRHFPTLFDATEAEQQALLSALNVCKTLLDAEHHPDGYNIGINQGIAGGQSVPHLHIHVIPRYLGDKADPKGGVRWVLPEKAKYWA